MNVTLAEHSERVTNSGQERLACDYCGLPVPSFAKITTKQIAEPQSSESQNSKPLYCCYGCNIAARITQSRGEHGQANWMLTSLGVSIAFTMILMVFTLSTYSRQVYGVDVLEPTSQAITINRLIRYISLFLATPVLLLLGWPILTNAIDRIRSGYTTTDLLIVLGVTAAFIHSYIATLTGKGEVYYETVCMVLVLFTLGRYLEAQGKVQASEAVKSLGSMLPDEVKVIRKGHEIRLSPTDLRVDDVLIVKAGDAIAADGKIESGRTNIDEQMLTGESTPVQRGPGDDVQSGSVNLDGVLQIRVTAVGAMSTMGRLHAILEDAKTKKSRFERLADRVTKFFVPLVILLSLVAAWGGYRRGSTDEAVMSGLALLLISCPCALGIATPMAIWIALGRAATQSILFRNTELIESLARVRVIAFDKTGTLTTGVATVSDFVSVDGENDEANLLPIASGLAECSNHPYSAAILRYAKHRGVTAESIENLQTLWGRGVTGSYKNTSVLLGSAAMMEEESITFDATMRDAMQRLIDSGAGIVCLAVDKKVVSVFGFSDELRPEAPQVITSLRDSGFQIVVLTGDHQQRGDRIAQQLGVPTLSELLPKDKLQHIEKLKREVGPVAMIGDGLNDSPALTAADVGIAMGCGADLTRESADVCLLGNDLRAIPPLLKLARATVRTIKVNLFWSFSYNVVGLGLALFGFLNPIIAAGAMVASSLFVVTHSLRLNHFDRQQRTL